MIYYVSLINIQRSDEKIGCVTILEKIKEELKLFFQNYECSISSAFDVMCYVGSNF